MSTSKNPNSSRTAQENATSASIASASAYSLPPIVPIKENEAIIDLIRSPVNNKLTPIESGAEVEKGMLVFEGRAAPYHQVIIFDNGVEIARVNANSSGKWVWSSDEFASGDHQFTVQIVGAGNPVSAGYDIEVGATPEQPVEVLFVIDDAAGYSRYIGSGESITDSTPRFSGTAAPNSLVQVFDGGREIGAVRTNSRGEWSFVTKLDGGDHSLVFVSGKSSSAPFVLNILSADAQPIEISYVYDNNNPYAPKHLKSGDITQDTTPRFDGKAGANVLIRLFDGEKEIGQTTSDAWGYWSLTPSLPAGSYNLVFKAGEGSATKPFALTISSADAQPVEVSYVYDNNNPYYPQPLKSGDTTQDSTPRFDGKAAPNVIIRLFNGDQEIGNTKSDAWGYWSLTPTLPAGSYNLVFKAGEGSESKPFALTITTADAKPIEIYNVYDDSDRYHYKPLKSGDTTQDTTPRFNGKAGANVIIRLFNGEQEIGTTLSDAYGNWSMTPTLPAGSYNLVFKAGEGSISKAFALNIASADAQPIEIFAALEDSKGYNRDLPPGATIKDTTPYFYGKAGANVVIRLYDGEKEIGSTKSGADGLWSLTPTLKSGSYNLVFKAGEGSETQPFPVTIIAPESEPVVITGVFDNSNGYSQLIQPGATSHDTTPTFIGRAGANVIVRLFDGEKEIGSAKAGASGSWTLTAELPLGSYNLVFKTDEGSASAPFPVTIASPEPVQPQTPEIEFILDNVGKGGYVEKNGTTDDDTPKLSGTAEPNSLVEIFDNGVKIGERRVSSTGFWEFTPVNPAYLVNGNHSFVVKSSNGTETAAWDIVVKVPVDITFIGSNSGEETGDRETVDSTPLITGFGPKGVLIRLFEGDKEIGSVMTSARDGSWIFNVIDPLSVGAHSIVAKAGNDNVSAQFDFVITAPDVPVEPEHPFSITEVVDNFFTTKGPISADAETDDNQPEMTGKAPANTLVRIFDNGIEIGSVMTNANGVWEFQPANALALGKHSFSVGDSAANASDAFSIDVVAAKVFAPWVLGGISEYDGIENFAYNANIYDNTPVLNGVAQVGSIVNIAVDGKFIGSAIADQYGRWSFQTTEPLAAGGHEVVATDANGNQGATLTFSLVDPEDFNISFNVFNDEAGETVIGRGEVTNDATPLLRGLAGQDIVLEIYDNGEFVGSVRTAQDGTWSFQLDLANGAHNITVKGEYQESLLPRQFTVEADAVTIDTITGRYSDYNNSQPSGGESINDDSIVLYGSAAPNATVQVLTLDGRSLGFTGATEGGKWYLEVDSRFEDGEHTVIAKVNGVESEPFIFHIGERAAIETQDDVFNLFDISGAELLSDAEETLLGKEVEAEASQVNLNLTQADLSVITTSGIATSTVAPVALQDEQYQAI